MKDLIKNLSLNPSAYNSDKIVDIFPFLTPYVVTVIPFCPPSLSFQPPSPPNNAVPQSTVRKKMAAVHCITIPCEANLAHYVYGKIWFNGQSLYLNSIALVEFK